MLWNPSLKRRPNEKPHCISAFTYQLQEEDQAKKKKEREKSLFPSHRTKMRQSKARKSDTKWIVVCQGTIFENIFLLQITDN